MNYENIIKDYHRRLMKNSRLMQNGSSYGDFVKTSIAKQLIKECINQIDSYFKRKSTYYREPDALMEKIKKMKKNQEIKLKMYELNCDIRDLRCKISAYGKYANYKYRTKEEIWGFIVKRVQ